MEDAEAVARHVVWRLSVKQDGNGEIAKAFEGGLNRHGYGFQYAVLGVAEKLSKAENPRWILECSEFPVAVEKRGDTRIDFILRRATDNWNPLSKEQGIYLVAECKRVNPAWGWWCFAKAPYVSRTPRSNRFIAEVAERRIRKEEEEPFRVGGYCLDMAVSPYHVAFEVKNNNAKGDLESGRKTCKDAIEDAAKQVCHGANGLVQHLCKRPPATTITDIVVVPVIFTTARLFATTIDLSKTDILSGNVDLSVSDLQEQSWVYLQYPVSRGLKHSFLSLRNSSELSDVLNAEYLRTIPIVSASGIGEFLRTFDFGLSDARECE